MRTLYDVMEITVSSFKLDKEAKDQFMQYLWGSLENVVFSEGHIFSLCSVSIKPTTLTSVRQK